MLSTTAKMAEPIQILFGTVDSGWPKEPYMEAQFFLGGGGNRQPIVIVLDALP